MSQVFVGVGSDEAIDMLIRIFCVPATDKILQCSPTYGKMQRGPTQTDRTATQTTQSEHTHTPMVPGMYSVSADTNDVGLVDVPLTPEASLYTTSLMLEGFYTSPHMDVPRSRASTLPFSSSPHISAHPSPSALSQSQYLLLLSH